MSLIIDIKVVPQSGRQLIVLDKSGMIKCFLKSPAQKNQANKELIKFLADSLQIYQQDITLLMGETQKKKRLKIEVSYTHQELLSKLGLVNEVQQKIC